MKKASFLILFVLLTNTAFALPTISSEDNQTFDENQAVTEIYDITVTEDPASTYITAGDLKLTIPDTIDIIFDSERTYANLAVYGTAVDSGKMDERPIVRFENGDRTLKIPILADFEPGESITITKIYMEGFNSSPSNSSNLILEIDGEQYLDEKYLDINSSLLNDSTDPDPPTNIEITDHENGVILTWTDPTDLDLNTIQILRGINAYPVSGTVYDEVGPGIEEFIDTEVEEGDTVRYVLRSNDGVNWSEQTAEYEFVVGSSTAEEPVEEPAEEPAEEPVEEPAEEPTEEPAEEPAEEPVEEPIFENPFDDVDGHWAYTEILKLAEEGIVTGQTETIFNPDGDLNRAEAAAIIYRIFSAEEPQTPTQKPFPDVPVDAWYAGYINELTDLNIINGHANGTFKPADKITRAEFFTLALNLYYYLADESTKLNIDDLKSGQTTDLYSDLEDDWYTPIITAMTELEFISGTQCSGENCVYANEEITRAEAVIPLYEMFLTN